MGVISNIKDTTRKVANSVVDTTQETLNIAKSPKELTKRMIAMVSIAIGMRAINPAEAIRFAPGVLKSSEYVLNNQS